MIQFLNNNVYIFQNQLSAQEERQQKVQQLLHYCDVERAEYRQRLCETLHEYSKLEAVVTAATKAVMDCAIVSIKNKISTLN